MNYSGKYTPEEYEKARLYRAAYTGRDFEWETLYSHDAWVRLYQGAPTHKELKSVKARETADKLYEESQVKKAPNTYSFVSAKGDVDVLRIIREAPKGSPFILIEVKDRVKNTLSNAFLLVHADLTTNPKTKNTFVYVGPLRTWDIECPWFADLTETSYFGHDLILSYLVRTKEQIAQVMKALSPKDSRTTVTVF